MARREPKPEAPAPAPLEREVEVIQLPPAEPPPPPEPWFTVNLGANLMISLEWALAIVVGSALLCVGSPDMLDALIGLVGRL